MSVAVAVDITLNGERHAVARGSTVAELLREMDLDPSRPKGIAVAVNDEVVPRGAWSSHEIREDDRVEVITALQGG